MLRRTLAAPLAIVLVALTCASSGGRAQSQPPQAVFRTNTDLVTIPVFVKGNDSDVGGLRASDFVLTDNGVAQQVETIDSESLPVDVTILMETGEAIEHYRDSLNEQVRKIAALMRPIDRIEVLGIDNYVSVLVPFGAPTRDLFEMADLLLAIDAPVPYISRVVKPSANTKIIHIAHDPMFDGYPYRGFPMDLAVAGNPENALEMLG